MGFAHNDNDSLALICFLCIKELFEQLMQFVDFQLCLIYNKQTANSSSYVVTV